MIRPFIGPLPSNRPSFVALVAATQSLDSQSRFAEKRTRAIQHHPQRLHPHLLTLLTPVSGRPSCFCYLLRSRRRLQYIYYTEYHLSSPNIAGQQQAFRSHVLFSTTAVTTHCYPLAIQRSLGLFTACFQNTVFTRSFTRKVGLAPSKLSVPANTHPSLLPHLDTPSPLIQIPPATEILSSTQFPRLISYDTLSHHES